MFSSLKNIFKYILLCTKHSEKEHYSQLIFPIPHEICIIIPILKRKEHKVQV